MLAQFFDGLQMLFKFIEIAKQKTQLIGCPFKMGWWGELGVYDIQKDPEVIKIYLGE